MTNNGNMPAMPCEVVEQYHIDASQVPSGVPTLRERKVMSGGMTKREMMAMHIFSSMQGRDGVCNIEHEVRFAVVAADHLLAELQSTK